MAVFGAVNFAKPSPKSNVQCPTSGMQTAIGRRHQYFVGVENVFVDHVGPRFGCEHFVANEVRKRYEAFGVPVGLEVLIPPSAELVQIGITLRTGAGRVVCEGDIEPAAKTVRNPETE